MADQTPPNQQPLAAVLPARDECTDGKPHRFTTYKSGHTFYGLNGGSESFTTWRCTKCGVIQ